MSSPSASTVAALDQAFSQLHIVPPIQSNPHAIPDSCSTTLSLSSLAFPRKVFKAWLRGGREKWVITPDDATGNRSGDRGTLWIGLSLSLSLLQSVSTYYHLFGQRWAGHADQRMPMLILPIYAVSKQDLCSHIKRTRHHDNGRAEREEKVKGEGKKAWFSLTF